MSSCARSVKCLILLIAHCVKRWCSSLAPQVLFLECLIQKHDHATASYIHAYCKVSGVSWNVLKLLSIDPNVGFRMVLFTVGHILNACPSLGHGRQNAVTTINGIIFLSSIFPLFLHFSKNVGLS
jgi:hypothetical protein